MTTIATITNAGLASLLVAQASGYAVQAEITSVQISDHYGTMPTGAETALPGNVVWTGDATTFTVTRINDSVLAFKILLDETVGDFNVGSVGLFNGSTLFALVIYPRPRGKLANSYPQQSGDVMEIHFAVAFTNISAAVNISSNIVTESDLPVVNTLADLPPAAGAPHAVYIVQNNGTTGGPSLAYTTGSEWRYAPFALSFVSSVAGKTGAVALTKSDVGLGNVDNTSDADKPISTAMATALAAKAPLNSPALTGTPTAPTAATSDSSSQLATTAFVKNAIAGTEFAKSTTVVSASTVNLGSIPTIGVVIIGTNAITSFGSTPALVRIVRFTDSLTLTYNATTLKLPGGIDIVTATGDTALCMSDSAGNWRVVDYSRSDGNDLKTQISTLTAATTTDLGSTLGRYIVVTGATTIASFGASARVGDIRTVTFTGTPTLTYSSDLVLPGLADISVAAGDCLVAAYEGTGKWRVVSYMTVNNVPGSGGGGSGGGSVTSVGLSLPDIFAVTGSPVTGAGTLSATLVSQAASRFLGSATTGAGVPSFRALSYADLPTIPARNLLANNTGSAGTPTGVSLTDYLDATIGSAVGGLLFRNTSAWDILPPSTTNGAVFVSAGDSAVPVYTTIIKVDRTNNRFGVNTSAPAEAVHVTGNIVATGDIVSAYSDLRLKKNIQPIENALDKVRALRGVYWEPNGVAGPDDPGRKVGVIAQEVAAVLPQAVSLAPFDRGDDGSSRSGENYLAVDYTRLVPLLIEAIKTLSDKIAELESRLS